MKNKLLELNNESIFIKLSFFLIITFPIILLIGSAVINTVLVLLNIFFIIHILKYKNFKIFNNEIFYFFIGFWILLILNTLLSNDFNNSYSRSFGFVRFILFFFLISYFFSYSNYKYKNLILSFWVLFFFIITIDLIFEFIFGVNTIGFGGFANGRLSGFMGDNLKIGHWYYGFALIILAYNFENKKVFYTILCLAIITSFLIGERANFLRLILACGFFVFLTKKITFRSILTSLILFLIIFFIGFQNIAIKARFYNHFIEQFTENKTLKNFNNNNLYTPMYLNAYDIFKNNIIFGTGVGTFWNESHKNFEKKGKINGYNILPNTHPHQYHFEILANLGLVGYLYLTIFFIYFFLKNIKFYLKTKNKLTLGCFIMLAVSLIPLLPTGSFFTTYGASIFWLNFALMNLGNINNIEDS